jgi:hypothetical protein
MELRGRDKQSMKKENEKREIVNSTKREGLWAEPRYLVNFLCMKKKYF